SALNPRNCVHALNHAYGDNFDEHPEEDCVVIGNLDGVFGESGQEYVRGWACLFGMANPATVHISNNVGGEIVAQADKESESEVTSGACGDLLGYGHRFEIPIQPLASNSAGWPIRAYATFPLHEWNPYVRDAYAELGNSGTFRFPARQTPT